jgi:hypothetical protein
MNGNIVFDKNELIKINDETNKFIAKAKKFIRKQQGIDDDILERDAIIKSQRDRIKALETLVRTMSKMLRNECDNNRKEK